MYLKRRDFENIGSVFAKSRSRFMEAGALGTPLTQGIFHQLCLDMYACLADAAVPMSKRRFVSTCENDNGSAR